jgi:SagB-type dehydrogenase family enzyme
MNPDWAFVTSPMFFAHGRQQDACATDVLTNSRFVRLGLPVFTAARFFLGPRTVAEAGAAGISPSVIRAGLACGALVRADNPLLPELEMWERHGWSRAAFLLFSQLDLDYVEPVETAGSLGELTEFRRGTIYGYLDDDPYPQRHTSTSAAILDLSCDRAESEPDLDAMVRRRSIRRFTAAPIRAEQFGGILHEATENIRIAEDSQAEGDPYFLLNSFYSWLEIYVVVQGVAEIERGVYQYVPQSHQLLSVGPAVDDAEIASCIQQQTWVGGAGFCMFVCADWRRYMWLYRHSRAYINLLIQAGEFSQEVLQAAYARGLGGWVTPALSESKAAGLLRLSDVHQDPVLFIKIGPPRAAGAEESMVDG